ncbi:MAG: hypothetical protein IT489_03180 [Gammaproteobacteria bacterium]|nr:hypothetical protein [Gammaproteobacteria bacterium]
MISVILSPAQLRLCREIVDAAVLLGDCTLRGYTVSFTDAGAVRDFRVQVGYIPRPTTRDYISCDCIDTKLASAIEAHYRDLEAGKECA